MSKIYQYILIIFFVVAGTIHAQFPDIGRISLFTSPQSSVQNLKIDNLQRVVISIDFLQFVESPLFDTTIDAKGNTDAVLVVYTQNLTPVFSRHIYGFGDENITNVSIDPANNITIVGRFTSTVTITDSDDTLQFQNTGNTDLFIAKYDSNGEIIWVRTINGPTNLILEGVCSNLQLGTTVVGSYSGRTTFQSSTPFELQGSSHYNAFLAHYDAGGELQFVDTTTSTINAQEQFNAVTSDLNDTIYATGRFQNTSYISGGSRQDTLVGIGGYDVFLSKFSPNGQLQWTQTIRSKSAIEDGRALALDNSGNIYVAGVFGDTAIFNDGTKIVAMGEQNSFVAKYSQSGTLLWTKTITTPTFGRINDVTFHNSQLYVTGTYRNILDIEGFATTLPSRGGNDIFLVQYDENGNVINATNYGADGLEIATNIAVSQDSSWIHITGNLKGRSIFNIDTLPILFYTTGVVVRLGGERLKPKELFLTVNPTTTQQIFRGDSVSFTVSIVDENGQSISANVTVSDSLASNHRSSQFPITNPNSVISISTNALKAKQLYTVSFIASKSDYKSSNIEQRFVLLVDTLQNLLNLTIVPPDTIVVGNSDSAIVSFIVTDSSGNLVQNSLITIVDSASSPVAVTARITGVNGAVSYTIKTSNKLLGLYSLRAIASKGGYTSSVEQRRLVRVIQSNQGAQQFAVQFQTPILITAKNCDTIVVRGIVRNTNGIPQSGVTIQVLDSLALPRKLITITTNINGEFTYSTIGNTQATGTHRIRFSYSKLGFTTATNLVSIQLTSLNATSLFLQVSPESQLESSIGNVISYQCNVKNGNCLPENGTTIIVINSMLSSSEQRVTNAQGFANYQFIIPPTIQPGLYVIKFVASKNSFQTSDTAFRVVKINPTTPQLEPLIVKVSPSQTTMVRQQCDSVILTAQVLDRLFVPVSGASVTMTTNAPVIPQFITFISNQQGIVQFPFQISKLNTNGLHRFDIIANKLGYDASNTETTFLRVNAPSTNEIFQVYPLDSIIALREGETYNFTLKLLDSFCVGVPNATIIVRDSLKFPPMQSFVETNLQGSKIYQLFISEGTPVGVYRVEFQSPLGTIITKRIHIYRPNFDNSKPQLVFPANFSRGVPTTTPLLWANFGTSLFYEWQLSDQSTVSSFQESGFTTQRVTFPTSLQTNRIYYWKVRAYGTNWISNWSDTWNFSTFPSSTSVYDSEISAFSLQPNPSSDKLNVSIPMYDEFTRIDIYNSVGSLVFSEEVRNENLQLDLQHLSNGLYTVRLTTMKGVYSKQFVKIQ